MKKKPEPQKWNPLWLVLAAALSVIVVAVVGGVGAMRDESPEREGLPRVRQEQSSMTQREMRERIETIRSRPPEDPAAAVEDIIAGYEQRIEANPDDPERPALFQAMGNAYRRRLLDYENAAWCYEQIILHYPDWVGTSMVYADLATCYERLDDPENAARIYMEMMRVLPDDSEEYHYARSKLGL